MAKVLGNDGTGWTPTTGNDFGGSAGAMCFAAGYVPLFNATITSFNIWIASGGPTAIQVCLYLGPSPSTGGATFITAAGGGYSQPGLQNFPCTPTNVFTTNTYSLFASCQSSSFSTQFNTGSSAFQCSFYNSTHFPYASPPGTTVNPRDAGTGHEFLVWADGTPIVTTDAGDTQLSGFNFTKNPLMAPPFFMVPFRNNPFQNFGPPLNQVPQSNPTGSYRRRMHRQT